MDKELPRACSEGNSPMNQQALECPRTIWNMHVAHLITACYEAAALNGNGSVKSSVDIRRNDEVEWN